MKDEQLMEGILQLEKGICDLYMHGTIEASTQNVHEAFQCALNSTLSMQSCTYDKMSSKGWYKTDCAEAQKITAAKEKFSQAM